MIKLDQLFVAQTVVEMEYVFCVKAIKRRRRVILQGPVQDSVIYQNERGKITHW